MNDRKQIFITIFVRGDEFSAISTARRVVAGGPLFIHVVRFVHGLKFCQFVAGICKFIMKNRHKETEVV